MVGIPAGWTQRAPGAMGAVTGVPVPTLNGVWAYRGDADPGAVSSLLERVKDAGMPYCLEFHPGCTQLREVAGERGMRREADLPLMVLPCGTELPPPGQGELAIEVLDPEQAAVHAELASAGFGAPVDVFLRVMTPAVLRLPGVRAYVGKIDGEGVVTGAGVHVENYVGIFNVATLPSHRRRGHGAAITVRAVRDAFDHGARWAWLQSSPDGYGVYEKLGFKTEESWECWIST